MDSSKTYSIANVRVEREADRYSLEIYLMLLDNSEHRKFQVGGFSVEVPEQQNRYSIVGPTGDTSIIKYVGGSDGHKYTRFSMPIKESVFDIFNDRAIIHFFVEDLSGNKRIRFEEIIPVIGGCYRR